jgi:hypothetical protein
MHKMKEEVILRILAQESPTSELRLQRYGEKKLWGHLCNFWKVVRGIFGIIFENHGVFLKIHGLRLHSKESKGPLYKIVGIFWFQIYFSIGKHRDRVHGSWITAALVHGGPGTEATAVAHQSSCS